MLVGGSYRHKDMHIWFSNGSSLCGSMVKQGLDLFEFRARGVNGKFLSQLVYPNVLKVAKPKFCFY